MVRVIPRALEGAGRGHRGRGPHRGAINRTPDGNVGGCGSAIRTHASAAGSPLTQAKQFFARAFECTLGRGLGCRAWRGLGWSSAGADGLGWEPGSEVESPLHPAGERVISSKACRLDTDEAGQGPAAESHGPHVRLLECLLPVLGANPDHECPIRNATAHIAV